MAVGLLLCLRSGAVRPVPLQGRWTLPHATFSVALTVCVRFQISVDLFCFAQAQSVCQLSLSVRCPLSAHAVADSTDS